MKKVNDKLFLLISKRFEIFERDFIFVSYLTNMTPQFLINTKGKKTGVFLSIKDYNKLMEELDELEDIKTYDKAKKRNEKTILLRDAMKIRKAEKLSHA